MAESNYKDGYYCEKCKSTSVNACYVRCRLTEEQKPEPQAAAEREGECQYCGNELKNRKTSCFDCLEEENQKLTAENLRYRKALKNLSCPYCFDIKTYPKCLEYVACKALKGPKE